MSTLNDRDKQVKFITDRNTDKFYRELAQIRPDVDRMELSEVQTIGWSPYTSIYMEKGDQTMTEYQVEYVDRMQKGKGFEKITPIVQCTQGNPITIMEQDMSRLRKLPEKN